MTRSRKRLRRMALFGAVLLAASLTSVAPAAPQDAAPQAVDPVPWNPPADHNVSTVRWGPITIPAAQNGQPGELHNQVAANNCGFLGFFWDCINVDIEHPFPGDAYITGMMPDLVYAGTDTSVNFDTGGMLHHVVNMNFSRPDPTCAPGFFGLINLLGFAMGGNERFFAAGNERTVMDLYNMGDNYGYFVQGSDQWGLIYHLMNFQPEPVQVEFKYTFSWVPSANRADPVWLDIDQCDDSELSIPAGYSDTHWGTTAQQGGTLLGIGGHAHDHAIDVTLENETKNRIECTSVAGYAPGSPFAPVGPGAGTPGHSVEANEVTSTGHPDAPLAAYQGHISDFTKCIPNSRIDWGDQLEVHTQYNHPTGADDAMGIMIAYVDWD